MIRVFKLLRFGFYAPFYCILFIGTIAGRRFSVPLFEALRKFAGVVISGTLRNLSDRLPAANQLHCRLLQTIFFDISVNRHAIDLLEQLLQMGHRHLINFNVVTINGHDFDQIESAVQAFHAETEKPTCIILDTVKGTGVSYMTNSVAWHGKGPNDEEYQVAMNELNAAYAALEQEEN